ncbi:dystrotelin [Chiroxiphia lanceolata]|uniref:dystrotelin n=1 Tax=Chiroxiphia lanceolata TaxID=296741 RepID=UPI0013CE713B|nr:dystrotelin [Chiroxiphia lanceolata]
MLHNSVRICSYLSKRILMSSVYFYIHSILFLYFMYPWCREKQEENMRQAVCLMPNAICSFQMDPDLQEAFNDVQSSVYRTALKLRSVQSLCQLDLIDVSLIQHILSSEQSQRGEQISLNMQQISRMLTELFRRARLEKPGQVDPRAAEFTLSLLIAMYDRSGTGYVKIRSAAAALIALSGDTLLAKYRAFFQFYAVPDGKAALITRSALRSLLTDLNQIPAIVGESCTLSCVEIATHDCFHGVLNSAIVEEKFLSWLRSEPAVLLWLPTCYRLSATEMVFHRARCRVCKVFPITGLRYRCLKCLNFDLCQACFFTGRLCKPHKRSHPVVEHCVQVESHFRDVAQRGSVCPTKLTYLDSITGATCAFITLVVNVTLFQERCRRKEAQRRRTLETVEERHFPTHKKTFPPAELSASPLPGPENLSFPGDSCVPESPEFVAENRTVMQKSENNRKTRKTLEQGKTIAQAIASFEADVLKMHESIKSIHSDSRYMKKQFNKWKDKIQFLHNCQEEKNCKIEAKLQRLRVSHKNLQMTLQQMEQEVKTMLQSSEDPFVLYQNTMPRNPHVLLERKMQGGLNPAQIRPTSRTCADWNSLSPPNPANRMQLLQTPEVATAVDFMFSDDPLESVSLQSDRPFMGQYEKANENQTYLPKLTENSLSGVMRNTVLTPPAVPLPPDEEEVREEMELQQLVMELKDGLSLQTQPAQQTTLQQELFSTAERVCRSFSDLINQVISPACE